MEYYIKLWLKKKKKKSQIQKGIYSVIQLTKVSKQESELMILEVRIAGGFGEERFEI